MASIYRDVRGPPGSPLISFEPAYKNVPARGDTSPIIAIIIREPADEATVDPRHPDDLIDEVVTMGGRDAKDAHCYSILPDLIADRLFISLNRRTASQTRLREGERM